MNGSADSTISGQKTGISTVRQAGSVVLAFLLRNRIVLVLTIVFCAATAGTLWHLSRLSSEACPISRFAGRVPARRHAQGASQALHLGGGGSLSAPRDTGHP